MISKHNVIDEPLGLKTDNFPTLIEIPTGGLKDKTADEQYRKLKDINQHYFKRDP